MVIIRAFRPSATLRTGRIQRFHALDILRSGETRSCQVTGTLRTDGDSVLSGPHVLSEVLFSTPGTLITGGNRSCQPPRYLEDWLDSVRSGPHLLSGLVALGRFRHRVPLEVATLGPVRFSGTLGAYRTSSIWPPRYPKDAWGRIASCPLNTLNTGDTHSVQDPAHLMDGASQSLELPWYRDK